MGVGEAEHRDETRQAIRFSKLRSHILPPSLLNFIAGLLAGAGINLLTSVATGPTAASDQKIVIDSIIWVLSAIFAAYAAHVAEGAERRAELRITDRLSAAEKHAIMRDEAAKVSGKFWPLVVIAVFIGVAAAVLIGNPGF